MTWEEAFSSWSQPPAKTEQERCENAERNQGTQGTQGKSGGNQEIRGQGNRGPQYSLG